MNGLSVLLTMTVQWDLIAQHVTNEDFLQKRRVKLPSVLQLKAEQE